MLVDGEILCVSCYMLWPVSFLVECTIGAPTVPEAPSHMFFSACWALPAACRGFQ